MASKIVFTQSNEATCALFGAFDANVKLIEAAFDVQITNKNSDNSQEDAILVSGEDSSVQRAARTLEYLKRMIGDGETIGQESIEYVIGLVRDGMDRRA